MTDQKQIKPGTVCILTRTSERVLVLYYGAPNQIEVIRFIADWRGGLNFAEESYREILGRLEVDPAPPDLTLEHCSCCQRPTVYRAGVPRYFCKCRERLLCSKCPGQCFEHCSCTKGLLSPQEAERRARQRTL